MENPQDRHTHASMSPARIEALIDGLFSIAMTLLALNITVPSITPGQEAALLPGRLWDVLPAIGLYAISFVVLGIYWVGHHAMFRIIDAADRTFLWINILFGMLVAFVPFSTSLISRYPGVPLAVQVYGIVLIMIGGSLYLLWSYAVKNHRLVPPTVTEKLIGMTRRRVAMAPAVCALAVLVAFVSPFVSIIMYAVIPPFYIAPGAIDRFVFRREPRV
jgi:TMEM175 potassium channel family protein